ncbi:TIGR00375 family protein [Evansella caseinilytica]|uniref:TIGR00375 family protein n=1 Tax=Evansella caseinilytica TaxID=1503961 RepID=A0A1H3L6F4_9BACI|nr:endonuclease Q family protein [Evansella caseinilytica]SDY59528.1 TIGR00375 family protein [Evansella caseinilytica]
MASLKNVYVDLHIHIGRTKSNKPVKITASRELTLTNILTAALHAKGLDVVGIIDAQSPEVLEEVQALVTAGEAVELAGGGIKYAGQLTILLGAEIEVLDESCHGPIHVLCFLPTLETMGHFSQWCSEWMKNSGLSSQRLYRTGRELQHLVKSLDGWFIPAHVFTPFKSLYGKGVQSSLEEVFDPELIDAVELGLSSDTGMADQLLELGSYPFLTNSDAHSVAKMAREHQIMTLNEASFVEMEKAFRREDGREIAVNVGLHPLLGKYYHSVCAVCSSQAVNGRCPNGHEGKVIRGVAGRIAELAALQQKQQVIKQRAAGKTRQKRPKYLHQVPLEFIPGCGPKTMKRLLDVFQTEMKVIHHATEQQLLEVVPKKVVDKIIQARTGALAIVGGGGGIYGKLN